MHVTVDDINFCDSLECVYVKYKSVHQQHMNCLINTWVFPLLKACETAFCIGKSLSEYKGIPQLDSMQHLIWLNTFIIQM